MAFDAGMLSCVVHEINTLAKGGKIEKIYQPERDEIIFLVRACGTSRRIVINVGSACPRISFTGIQKENPMQAPMFCMLLRKHLVGAMLSDISQEGFERVARLTFETHDEMGFESKKYIFAEIMGKYSNLIFTDENKKIISAIKTVDFSTSSLRQILTGMIYELPPSQNKQDPLLECKSGFETKMQNCSPDIHADKFITSSYLGISSSNAREICYRVGGSSDISISACDSDALWNLFEAFINTIKEHTYSPCVVFDGSLPVEYSFVTLTHYPSDIKCSDYTSPSDALDAYYDMRDKEQRIKQRASDILKMLTNAESRITRKLELQRNELADCALGSKYKKYGDLITSNMYKLQRGQKTVELEDYESWDEISGEYKHVVIDLDERLSTAANAQKYYKKYNKAKKASVELTKQIRIGTDELEYIHSVFDALAKAETQSDLQEIRDELYISGYASKMHGYASSKKKPSLSFAKFKTTNGYAVYCGKNNLQNEYITHKLACKHDYWFHAKGIAGSHVLLVTNGEEPPAEDFTDACMIAAYYSKAKGQSGIEVDYLLAKGVKKVAGSKPGFVIYNSNWSAYVTPDEAHILAMRDGN